MLGKEPPMDTNEHKLLVSVQSVNGYDNSDTIVVDERHQLGAT